MNRLTNKEEMIHNDELSIGTFHYYKQVVENSYKVLEKLGQLEDVLEEFGIESADELRGRLSKAIVPKFEIGQEVWAVDVLRKDNVDCFIITEIGYLADYGIYYKTNQGINLYEYYFDIFPTQAEAQAKLDEIRRK